MLSRLPEENHGAPNPCKLPAMQQGRNRQRPGEICLAIVAKQHRICAVQQETRLALFSDLMNY
jgi:hypothetical protein